MIALWLIDVVMETGKTKHAETGMIISVLITAYSIRAARLVITFVPHRCHVTRSRTTSDQMWINGKSRRYVTKIVEVYGPSRGAADSP